VTSNDPSAAPLTRSCPAGANAIAAVAGIRLDRLPVRCEQDQQQHDDRRDDRAEHGEARGPDREQDRQRGFRAVGRRCEAIEPHRRHRLERADLARALLAIGEPPPQEQPAQ